MKDLRNQLMTKLIEIRNCKESNCSNEITLQKLELEKFNYMSKLAQLNTNVRNGTITQQKADKKRLQLRKQVDYLKQSIKVQECVAKKCKKEFLSIISFIKQHQTNAKVIASIDRIYTRYQNNTSTMSDYLKLMNIIESSVERT